MGEMTLIFTIFWFFCTLVLWIMVVRFTVFHLGMVLRNNTTLEVLDGERKGEGPIKDFDLGKKRNWEVVFGPSKLAWFLPLPSAKMTSDGIIWMKKENLINDHLINETEEQE